MAASETLRILNTSSRVPQGDSPRTTNMLPLHETHVAKGISPSSSGQTGLE